MRKRAKEEPPKKPSKKKLIFLLGGIGIFLIGAFAGTAVYLGWIEIPGLSFSNKTAQAAPEPGHRCGPHGEVEPPDHQFKRVQQPALSQNDLGLGDRQEGLGRGRPGKNSLPDRYGDCDPGGQRIEDLRKTEARENVKKELLQKANLILAGEKIRRIYFDEFLFQ